MDGAKFDVTLVDFGLAMQGSIVGTNTQITVAGLFIVISSFFKYSQVNLQVLFRI